MSASERILIDGPVGAIETVIDACEGAPRGLALVAHPNPLMGGTMDNKVTQTLAKTFVELGYTAVRSNFRGVGASAGSYDEGRGETEDLLAVLHAVRERLQMREAPLVLAGFSFGTLVLSRVAQRVHTERIVFVGTAITRGAVEKVPEDSLIIHGEKDETVPLGLVLRWAETMDLPVVVIPAADHFFHHRLHSIRNAIIRAWR